MKKIIPLALLALLTANPAVALELTSDENGAVTVSEPQLKVGDMAPKVTLIDNKFKKQSVGGATGHVQIISTIESFNTSVCDLQTMQFEQAAKKLPQIEISVITANMPFIVDAFKTGHKIQHVRLLSSFNTSLFGKEYGVGVTQGELTGILARSVFVVDQHGKVIYKEITSNIDKMPNLKQAISIAEQASKK